jgi:glutamyl-Q tRNA(Asp) synthetase
MSAPRHTRFAPSPTGHLHLGHVYAAVVAQRAAHQTGGLYRVRIEDIDLTRCRPQFEAALLADLAWLGLGGDGPVRRQSDHWDDYRAVLGDLGRRDLIYPCFCTRKQIQDEIARAGDAPHHLADGTLLYPRLCHGLSPAQRDERIAGGAPYAWRLDLDAALGQIDAATLGWWEWRQGEAKQWIPARPQIFGDIVLARKDMPTSYHLAVTHDDAAQQINFITRGEDLFDATHIQIVLWALMGHKPPEYSHHRLIVDADGRRIAKRDNPLTIAQLREAGHQPHQIIAMIDDDRARV